MVILNISEVLPAPIKDKATENDILLVTATKHQQFYPDAKHFFVLVIPYVSWITTLFSNRWTEYFVLRKKGSYSTPHYSVSVIALPKRGYGIPLLRPLLNWLSYKMNKKKLLAMVDQHHPDIIHAHNVHNTAYLAKKIAEQTGIPYIVTVRKISHFKNSPSVRQLLSEANAVISISPTQKKTADLFVSTRKSYLLPHGVDDSFINYIQDQQPSSAQPIKLISICRLIPLKNIDTVILVLAKINLPFIYTIYGEGDDYQRLHKLVSSLSIKDNVHFMGHVQHEQVLQVLASHDIFIMPSYPETLGRVFLEAMGIGLPVIAAKDTGIDGFIENGISGFLVDHTDVDELSSVLSLLISDAELRKTISFHAKKKISEFSWVKIIHRLHEIYSSVTRKN